jgi:TolB-like protein/Tfp pilus assembly protein PilF
MNEKAGGTDRNVQKFRHRIFSRHGMLALAAALVLILAFVIGLNIGGLRKRLLGGIGTPRIESIAVLPFENLSHDPTQEYFADGMTQMFIRDMQQIGTFRMIGPTSVMQYKKAPKPLPEIAQELNIDAVVEGGVLRSGDRVRISANLIHVPTNRRLWGQTYERDLGDVLNLQAELLRAVARAIDAKLTPQVEENFSRPRPVNPQAHDALLRGMWGGNPAKTETFLNQAIQLDPAYADPYDYLGARYYMRNMYPTFAPGDTYPKAKAAAQKALSLNPIVSLAHRILASAALEYDWNFVEAEKEWKRELELVPNGPNAHHYYAHFLLSMGRMEEAKAESRRAMELDPLGSSLMACVSWHDIATGNFEDAEKHASQALSMGAPEQLARLTLGWSYALRGRHDEAIPEFQKAVVGWQGAVFPTAVLGHAYAAAGKEDAAREVLNRLLARSKTDYVSPYEIAMIYAGLSDRDRAFEWLEKAYEERATLLVYFRMDPRIWSLRSDARFQDLLRRMNFPSARRN